MGQSNSKSKVIPTILEDPSSASSSYQTVDSASKEAVGDKKEELNDTDSTVIIRPKKKLQVPPSASTNATHSKRISFYEQVDATEVLPFLILGNQASAKNEEFLRRKAVKYVLNLTDTDVETKMPGVQYKTVTLQDDDDQELLPFLEDCFTFIDKARPKGPILLESVGGGTTRSSTGQMSSTSADQRVLVCSYFGISRTSALALAYLMRTCGCTLRSAFYHLKERNPSARPNEGFVVQLLRYDQDLHNGAMSMTLRDFYQ